MGAITQSVGSKAAVTVTGLSTLASGTYCVSAAITPNTNKPVEVVVELSAVTLGAPSGNKRMVLFVIESIDGTNYRKGPTGGTDATDEAKLLPLGVLEMGSDGDGRATYPIARVLGYVPPYFKVIIKNETGGALVSGSLAVSEVSMSVA